MAWVGFLVIGAGYSATFLALSTVAAVAWLLLLTAMPETGKENTVDRCTLFNEMVVRLGREPLLLISVVLLLAPFCRFSTT
jgi:predicted MFS family arabinose efflux permease